MTTYPRHRCPGDNRPGARWAQWTDVEAPFTGRRIINGLHMDSGPVDLLELGYRVTYAITAGR